MIEIDNIFIERAGEDREAYELDFLLNQFTISEIATKLGITTTVVSNHMKRHISLETREKLCDYLPSTAAQLAEILIQTKGKALDLLRQDSIDDSQTRLLNTLIGSSSKFLEKYAQIRENIPGINAPITINYFELASKEVLPSHPEVYLEIKRRMIELEKGKDFEVF